MASTTSASSLVMSYLKRTVMRMMGAPVPQEQVDKGDAMKAETPCASESQLLPRSRPKLKPTEARKRKERSLSPSLVDRKRLNQSENRNQIVLYHHTDQGSNNDLIGIHSAVQLKCVFNQLLWTLKHVRQNPAETENDLREIIESLCNGLKSILLPAGINLDDRQFRQFLRIADNLFNLLGLGTFDDNASLATIRLRYRVETVLDCFLDKFYDEGSNAEGHLKCYGLMSSVMYRLKDKSLLEALMKKLVLRLYSTTTALWEACVRCENGIVELIDSEPINLFFYFCQLLEVLITVAPTNSQQKLNEQIHDNLKALENDAGSLFQMLPNLGIILYGTILAAKPQTSLVQNVCVKQEKLHQW